MTNLVQIKFEAKIKCGIKYDDATKIFVTYAPGLGLYSQGESELQAKNALDAAIKSFLFVAYKNNVLDRCLHLVGFKPMAGMAAVAEKQNGGKEEEYIVVSEEKILEQNKYNDVYETSAFLPLESAVACHATA